MVIFYFSGTGNTQYVSEYFNHTICYKGIDSTVFDITKISQEKANEIIEEKQSIFLAYPIYGSDMPENMKVFIDQMPQGDGKLLGVICTQVMISGDGASIEFEKLKAKGYNQKWAHQINMPNNLCIKGSPFKQCADYSTHEKKYLKKARLKLDAIADKVIEVKAQVTDNRWYNRLVAQTQRPAYRKYLQETFVKGFDVDQNKCTGCGLCVKICPNKVIVDKGKIVFENRSDCTNCFRCINFCPQAAILYKGKIKLPQYKGPTQEVFDSIIKK